MTWFLLQKMVQEEDKTSLTSDANNNFTSENNTAEPELNYMEKLAQDVPKIHDALELMRQYSSLGKRFVDWSKKLDISITETIMPHGGLCYASKGQASIEISHKNSTVINISVLAHELMHAVQGYVWGRLKDSPHRNGRARILHNRALEAGAETCAIKICFEMKQNGYPDAFDIYLTLDKDSRLHKYGILFEIYEQTYLTALHENKTHEDAIQDACNKVFHAYYEVQSIIDLYNSNNLKRYIDWIINNPNTNSHATTAFGEYGTRRLTEMGDDEFLITQVNPDISDKGLFGDNVRMRQAFEYVEHIRLLNISGGETNFGVRLSMQGLIDDQNPYLNLELKDIVNAFNEQKTDEHIPNLIDIMNELSGVTNPQQTSLFQFVFTEATDKKSKTIDIENVKVTLPQNTAQTKTVQTPKTATPLALDM